MSDVMLTGVTHLAAQLKSYASQLVSYKRSGSTIASFYATPALKDETVVSADGEVSTICAGRFIMTAADFIADADDSAIEIDRGDTIVWGTRTFKVLAPAPHEQPKPLDPHGIQIAIKVEEVFL